MMRACNTHAPTHTVGGIIAPFIAMAGAATGSSLIPFLTFGAASLLGGLLIFTLPETLGAPLPDTMDDMGAIASIFTNKTLALRGVRAAAASLFKTRVRLPQQGARGGGVPALPCLSFCLKKWWACHLLLPP